MSKPLSEWGHRDFVEDLAEAKNHTIMEVNLGAAYQNKNQIPRADVVEINPSYTDFYVTIYEVKQDRGDILGSLKSGKYEKYLEHCHRFYFACRKGIVKKKDIPEDIGLILRNENGWYSRQAGNIRKNHTIPRETMHSYLFKRLKYLHSMDRRERIARHFKWDRKLQDIGEEVSDALSFSEAHRAIFQVATKNGFTNSDINKVVMSMVEGGEIMREALSFLRKFSYQIRAIADQAPEDTDELYFVKHHLRKLLRELRSSEN